MDIPASRVNSTGGSSSRLVTNYGLTKYDSKEVSSYFCGDGPGHGTYRKRSRSTSPGRFNRAGLNDRVDPIASSNNRTDMSRRTRRCTCKFFASGNCRYENICWYSHSDQARDSFNNYKVDDRTQAMDTRVFIAPAREGLEGSGATLDFNVPVPVPVPVPNWVKNDVIGEQRLLRSSADDHAVSDNRYMAHSSYLMSSSEPRGAAFLGANIEGSVCFMGNQLLTPNVTSRKPDILDTVRSEAAASGQCLRSSEQIPNLTDILAQLLDEIRQRPNLYAALSTTNALLILQSCVSGSAGPDVPAASSGQLDLVTDCLELIKEKLAEVALSSKETTDRKSRLFFKAEVADFIKKLLNPAWHSNQIEKEAFKGIVKVVVRKVLSSFQGICIPQTQEDINIYLYTSGPCISKLVLSSLEKYKKKKEKAGVA